MSLANPLLLSQGLLLPDTHIRRTVGLNCLLVQPANVLDVFFPIPILCSFIVTFQLKLRFLPLNYTCKTGFGMKPKIVSGVQKTDSNLPLMTIMLF